MKRKNQNLFISLILIILISFFTKYLSTHISDLKYTNNKNNLNNINNNSVEENITNNRNNDIINNTTSNTDNTNNTDNSNISNDTYKVLKVVDGDTIKIKYNGKTEKVRLIGIDTPESVSPNKSKNCEEGKIASNFTKNYLEGKNIKIEFDVQQRDKYNRLLAYIYIDNQMYNEILLKEGYAKLDTVPPNIKYVNDFKKLQEKARKNKKEFWSYYYK